MRVSRQPLNPTYSIRSCKDDQNTLKEFEEEIDWLAASIWGLNKDELKEIRHSLEEIL